MKKLILCQMRMHSTNMSQPLSRMVADDQESVCDTEKSMILTKEIINDNGATYAFSRYEVTRKTRSEE